MKALLAKKIGMTQLVAKDGVTTPVTILEAGPCTVTQLKSLENEGYMSIQIGFGKAKKMAKPQVGHQAKAKSTHSKLTEYRVSQEDEITLKVGDVIKADIFEIGEKVSLRGISKGKGFAGTIKRHNFARGPKTHGSHNYRAPGSIGAGYPQHVIKGIKMAGRMGSDQVTVKNLTISAVDVDKNLIAVKGAVPGPNKSIVEIVGV